jgi:DNA replication protein DnaC
MNAGMKALLMENLKTLKLSTMTRNLKGYLRQAQQDKLSYEEFLLNLTEIEVQVRKENGRKRRLREAKFPLLKLTFNTPFTRKQLNLISNEPRALNALTY